MAVHKLKLRQDFWYEVKRGRKTAEVRKDDRGYQVGDVLHLVAVDDDGQEVKTNGQLFRTVSHILQGGQYGIESGYVMLSIVF